MSEQLNTVSSTNDKCQYSNPSWYKNNCYIQVPLLDLLQVFQNYRCISMKKLLKENNHFQMNTREDFKYGIDNDNGYFYIFRNKNLKFKKIYNNFKKSALHYPLSVSDVNNMKLDIHSILKYFAGDFIHEAYKHIDNVIVCD